MHKNGTYESIDNSTVLNGMSKTAYIFFYTMSTVHKSGVMRYCFKLVP